MKANVGQTDRLIRLIAALAVAGFGAVTYASGGAPLVYLISFGVAAVLAITATLRFCPAYTLVGIKTCKACCGGGCSGAKSNP